MIIPVLPLAFALGAAFGWRRSTQRGGARLDKVQYAAVHGIVFTLIALIIMVILGHLLR